MSEENVPLKEPRIVKEQHFPNGDMQAFWDCGCVTEKIGDHFFINPCSQNCVVLKIVVEESRKRGNKIEVRHELRGYDPKVLEES